MFSVAVGALVSTQRDPDVSGGSFVFGVIVRAGLLGALPVWAYFALGRALARHRVVLALLLAVSVVPLIIYAFVAPLFVLELVHCPPDAYECPV